MLDCNSFMEAHMNDLDDFFKQVVKDEKAEGDAKPFADLLAPPKASEENLFALSFKSYEFMNWMLLEYKEALLEGLEGYLGAASLAPLLLTLSVFLTNWNRRTPRHHS